MTTQSVGLGNTYVIVAIAILTILAVISFGASYYSSEGTANEKGELTYSTTYYVFAILSVVCLLAAIGVVVYYGFL